MILGLRRAGLLVWLPVTLVALWWFSSSNAGFFFPPLPVILERFAFHFLSANIVNSLFPSLINLGIGLTLAILIGSVGGVLLGLSPSVRAFLAPAVHFLRSLPPPALLPLFMALFGIGVEMKIWVIAFTAIFPILLNAMDGVYSSEPRWLDVCRSYRVSSWRRFWVVILPGASPQIASGVRVSLQISLLLMVVSEMLASTGGVGFLILQSQQQFRIPDMWAGIIMLGILGFLLNAAFDPIERAVLKWHLANRASA